jgi:hypothetical protein
MCSIQVRRAKYQVTDYYFDLSRSITCVKSYGNWVFSADKSGTLSIWNMVHDSNRTGESC